MRKLEQSAIEHFPLGLFYMDREGRITDASRELAAMLGWDGPEQLLRQEGPGDNLLSEAERARIILGEGSGGTVFSKTFNLMGERTGNIWLTIRAVAVDLADGTGSREEPHILGVLQDVTEQRNREHRLANRLDKYTALYQSSPEGILLCTAKGVLLECNETLADMLGYDDPPAMVDAVGNLERLLEAHGDHWQDVVGADGHPGEHPEGSPGGYSGVEVQIADRKGKLGWFLLGVYPIRDVRGRVLLYQLSFRDVSRKKEVETLLNAEEHEDHLTGLFTLQMFTSLLGKAVARSRRSPENGFALVIMDVDRLHLINESLGKTGGDELLAGIARVLQELLREEDICARIGGDEFALLLAGVTRAEDAIRVVRRINEAFSRPLVVRGQEVYARLRSGIVLSSPQHESAESLLADADMAMYKARLDRGEDMAVFSEHMQRDAVARLNLETDLRGARDRGEFTLYYQPIVSLKNGRIGKFEALLRWERPGVGMIPPLHFIPLLEEMGLIVDVGHWAMCQACEQLRLWQSEHADHGDIQMSVNVSARQLDNGQLERSVSQALGGSGLPPGALELEITESLLMEDPDLARDILTRLHGQGVNIAIDDFGTGHSSLAYLHTLPTTTLKIDRSFLRDIKAEQGEAIVRTIQLLARSLGKNVVAEGVETDEQFHKILGLGCEYAQGFFFSRPLPADEASDLLAKGLKR